MVTPTSLKGNGCADALPAAKTDASQKAAIDCFMNVSLFQPGFCRPAAGMDAITSPEYAKVRALSLPLLNLGDACCDNLEDTPGLQARALVINLWSRTGPYEISVGLATENHCHTIKELGHGVVRRLHLVQPRQGQTDRGGAAIGGAKAGQILVPAPGAAGLP
jgi:hypothetical protein